MGHAPSRPVKRRSPHLPTNSASTLPAGMVIELSEFSVTRSTISSSEQASSTSSATKHNQRFEIMRLKFELRTEVLLKCMQDRSLHVSRDIHGRLRISNLPTVARASKRLRRETLRAVFVYGAFVLQSSATNAQFERQLSSTILRFPIRAPSTGVELISKLNFAAFSHFSVDGITSSLALVSRCPNLRTLILNIELQHMAEPDWASPNWYKTVSQLRAEYQFDSVFSNGQLRTLVFTGTGIGLNDDYLFSGAEDLATFFTSQYLTMQRTTEVLLETPPEEVWPKDEEEEDD